jgi:hypothetical protein
MFFNKMLLVLLVVLLVLLVLLSFPLPLLVLVLLLMLHSIAIIKIGTATMQLLEEMKYKLEIMQLSLTYFLNTSMHIRQTPHPL